MAEKPAETAPPPPKGGKGKLIPILIVGGLMLVEGAGVFFVARMTTSAPSAASGADTTGHEPDAHGEHGADKPAPVAANEDAELVLSSCRPTNKMGGKIITFSIRVSILVPRKDVDGIKAKVTEKQSRIDDRVNFVIRSAEIEHLNEPGLDTIKRRIRFELSKIFGDEVQITEVLIPEMLQSGTGV